jgi:hypothetical protein
VSNQLLQAKYTHFLLVLSKHGFSWSQLQKQLHENSHCFRNVQSLCYGSSGTFWYATGLAQAIFGLGAAYGHIVQMVVFKDFAPENSGIFLYSEIVWCIVILGLMLAYRIIPQHAQDQRAAWGSKGESESTTGIASVKEKALQPQSR